MKYAIWYLVLVFFMNGAVAGDSPKWLENLNLSGDFRARAETTDYDARKDRQRYRIRFRIKATWTLNESWLVGTRVVTGNPDDHLSTHQTLDDGFGDFEISLDRAFIQYSTGPVKAMFGKFAHPFKALGVYPEILWDADIQPEGMALSYKGDYFYAAAGYYVLDERSDDSDLSEFAGQVGGQSSGKLPTTWALAYYSLDDVEEILEDKINLFEAQVSLGFNLGRTKGRAALQYIHNTNAVTDEDTGVVLGVEVKTKGFLDRAYLQYQKIEDEAVYDYLAQDDNTANKNFEGIIAGVTHPLWKTISAHLWVLTAEPIIGEGGTDVRYRLDINARL
ncbi:MAG: putative porin [Acidobacteriota bacterium]|nr:putative porin [Acidobacteriota bacterium]